LSRVSIVTLGCPKNAVDSEALGGMLASEGHEMTDDPSTSDVIVVNTCGFIDPARRETVQEVLDLAELKSSGSASGLILTGCLVARSATDLEHSLPEVDAFVDFAAYPQIGSIVDGVIAGSLEQRVLGAPGTRFDPAWWDAALMSQPRVRFGRAPWAYLKIAEGCDRGCTFCAIPLMRGKFRSRPMDVIEAEARSLVELGISELSLVSQDSVMWGRDTAEGDLTTLLERLEAIEGLRRIRLMYLHPQGVSPALIEKIVASDSVVSYFDLSLQHVAPRVLRGMGRWGSRARFDEMVTRIRELDPLAGIRATFILGFPGETDEDAEEVAEFVRDAQLDWIGTFVYSREEGTRSFEMSDAVPEAIARERHERVSGAADIAMETRAATLIGRSLRVLVERYEPDEGVWSGRSQREAPEVDGEITFEGRSDLKVGDYVDVVITGHEGADLVGRLET
jgi:ribosomal protein S12 methylthiotransferase